MGVGFSSYEIARSGLTVNERALYVTGHNISNVNTPGYVRQQAIITDVPSQSVNGKFQIGLGANIQQIRQIRHTFLDNIYRKESTTLGYWESRQKTFQDVQAILNEPFNEGLQDVMNQFWDSWQELAKDPSSLTTRAMVAQRGENLVHQINHMGAQLDKLQNDLNSEIAVRINEVNQITGSISRLNIEIAKAELAGDTANDYRDQRNTLADRLSKLVNADISEASDGQVIITLGGYFLVNKGTQTKLYPSERNPGDLFYVPMLEGTNNEVPLKSGIIKGLMESRGDVSATKGSVSNGTPNTKADLTFVIDVSDGSAANLAKIQSSIDEQINELKKHGIDYNLRLITYKNGVSYNHNFGNDDVSFISAVKDPLMVSEDNTDLQNNFTEVVDSLKNITDFRPDANKYAFIFTNESIGGDGNIIDDTAIDSYINGLKGMDIKTSVITDTSYFTNGDGAAEKGWDSITNATGGNLYNLASLDNSLMATISSDINRNINDNISVISQPNGIVSDLKKQLNALINIMAREINYIHGSGITLDNRQGQDFFTVIDPSRPLEMGNIKLNISRLDDIAASESSATGNGNIALRLANLRNKPIMRDVTGVLSLDDYYQSLILSIGNGGWDAQNITESQQRLVQSSDLYRQSISGVSMDEEMGNMMKYKFAYDASSRAINAIDEMIDTIINRMGLVGR